MLHSVLELALLMVAPCVVVAALAIRAGRRRTASSGEFDSDSVSFVGGVLSAVFTVVLAFYVVFAWQIADDIDTSSHKEVDSLVDTYWQVGVAPQPERDALRADLERYATRVVHEEWDSLGEGRPDPGTSQVLASLRSRLMALPTDSEGLKIGREQALQDAREVDSQHRTRVDKAASDDPFTELLLVGTLLGAVTMLVFPLLIGLSPRPGHIAAMVLMTATIGALAWASIELISPLHGVFGAEPDAFEAALRDFALARPA